MGAWFVKFIGGLLPGINKSFVEWIGKMMFYAILITIGITIYHKTFEPKTITKIEKIETQIVNQCPEKDKVIGLHFNLWKLKIGAGI